VTVTNSVLVSAASGIKLGTESHGDFRHCVFSNCVIRDTWSGISIFAKDGGVFENISFSNITIHSKPSRPGYVVTWPIFVDLDKRWPGQARMSAVRDVNFSDIRIHGKGRVRIAGMPERFVENVTLRNVQMRATGFEPVEKARKPAGGRAQPARPEADFGNVSAAFIFANARGICLDQVRILWDLGEPPLERHALFGAHLEDVRIHGFTGRQSVPGGWLPVISFDDVKDVFISGSRADPGAGVFVSLKATPPREVVLEGNDLRNARLELKE
jgi:hypothetical protein